MKKTTLTLAVMTTLLMACNQPKPEQKSTDANTSSATSTTHTPSTPQATPTGDTAETSLDWNGEYEGVLPCADCEGIKTKLELNNDKTYELTEEYLGKGSGKETETKGTFNFDNTNSSIIILDKAADNRKFFIGEGFAEARAVETGEAITGPLAEHYKLKKQLQ